jgi:sterol desaturase/sphingolipid hydroxylase (fatty acid hydroxylase superfamily)
LLVVGIGLASWHLLGTDLPRPVASGVPLLASVLVILVLERLFPVHRAWNARPDGKDLALLVINRVVDIALLAALVTFMDRVGTGFGAVWPQTWPVAVQVAVGITLAEGIRYLLHRLSHRPGWLWRVHRTHHEPERMYVLNGPRLHPANYLWVAAAHGVPMLLLGASFEVVVVTINVTALFVVFQHANLRLRFDGLNRVFATPDVHRLHHARDMPRAGVNYSVVLVLIDRMFGTYAPPAEVEADGIGLAPSQEQRAGLVL